MGLTDVMEYLEDSQLNYLSIREALRPLFYTMPSFVTDLYNSLDWNSNTVGVSMKLKEIQEQYQQSSILYKLLDRVRGGHLFLKDYFSKEPVYEFV